MKTWLPALAGAAFAVACSATITVHAHGLVEDPPARNWFCGLDTPPDKAARNDTAYPVCKEVFSGTGTEGYQFMSVLTHDVGRAAVTPLPGNVCGFNSETFGNGATPWDRAADWPTTPLQPGRNKFTWNISWGPHFSDTEEFRYWITRPGFSFDARSALAWSDFDSEPFCVLAYDDGMPDANPDVIARPNEARFDTYCSVPPRDGHHVIYAEWGRNYYTFERFHGCMDVQMGNGADSSPPPGLAPQASIETDPAVVDEIVGAATIRLSAAGNDGIASLSYRWSVMAPDSSGASLTDATAANAMLRLADPTAAGRVDVSLRVQSAVGSDTASFDFAHTPTDGADWSDLGQLTEARTRPGAGDRVQLRLVDANGADTFLPTMPLVLDQNTIGPRDWPVALATAIANSDDDVAIGVLARNGELTTRRHATRNRVYVRAPLDYVGAFIEFERADQQPVDQPPAERPSVGQPPPGEPPSVSDCSISTRPSSNAWWAGFDVATDAVLVRLDFSNSDIDLSQVIVDAGVFDMTIDGQTLTLGAPGWVSRSTPGYFGIRANNLPALGTLQLACG